MSEIFNDENMKKILKKHMPDGEKLIAGVHGIGMNIDIIEVRPNYVYVNDQLVPTPNSKNILHINKRKLARFDAYIGITEHYLLFVECEPNGWMYEFSSQKALVDIPSEENETILSLEDVGTRFPFTFIQSFEVKKGWFGSLVCTVKMEAGSCLKFMIPKLGGLGNGMPHHVEYRQTIIDRLNSLTNDKKEEKLNIEKTNTIDGIGIDKNNSKLTLLLADGMDWYDEFNHLQLLQDKVNNYIAYIESKQYLQYLEENSIEPDSIKQIEIHIKFLYKEPDNCKKFLEQVEKVIKTSLKNTSIYIENGSEETYE